MESLWNETAHRLEAGAELVDVQSELSESGRARLEVFVRDELARRRTEPTRHARRTRAAAIDEREGNRGKPAAMRAGGLGLADTGGEKRAVASTVLATASPEAARR